VALAERNELAEALGLDGEDDPLGVGVQVRAVGGQLIAEQILLYVCSRRELAKYAYRQALRLTTTLHAAAGCGLGVRLKCEKQLRCGRKILLNSGTATGP
jgi:hypothetical protein